jgi:hypothetical protein
MPSSVAAQMRPASSFEHAVDVVVVQALRPSDAAESGWRVGDALIQNADSPARRADPEPALSVFGERPYDVRRQRLRIVGLMHDVTRRAGRRIEEIQSAIGGYPEVASRRRQQIVDPRPGKTRRIAGRVLAPLRPSRVRLEPDEPAVRPDPQVSTGRTHEEATGRRARDETPHARALIDLKDARRCGHQQPSAGTRDRLDAVLRRGGLGGIGGVHGTNRGHASTQAIEEIETALHQPEPDAPVRRR